MNNLMITLLSAFGILVFGFFFGASSLKHNSQASIQPSQSSVQLPFKEGALSDWVEARAMNSDVQYSVCKGSETTADSNRILVSVDVAKCGQSVTLKMVDGSVVSGSVSGILEAEPFNSVRLYGLDLDQVVEIVRH